MTKWCHRWSYEGPAMPLDRSSHRNSLLGALTQRRGSGTASCIAQSSATQRICPRGPGCPVDDQAAPRTRTATTEHCRHECRCYAHLNGCVSRRWPAGAPLLERRLNVTVDDSQLRLQRRSAQQGTKRPAVRTLVTSSGMVLVQLRVCRRRSHRQ